MDLAIHNAQFSNHLGGTERLIYYQIKELLEKESIKITLITKKTSNPSFLYEEIKNLKKNNLEIIELEVIPKENLFTSNNPMKWHLESLEFGLAAYDIYIQRKFDAVITHFSTDSLFISKNQVNILHLHGVPSTYSEIGELSVRIPQRIIAVSKYVGQEWLKFYPYMKREAISIVYPGIDSNKFKKIEHEKTFDIIFVGRFISIKGIDTLIEAVSKIKEPIKVCLVGDGPDKEKIKEKIKSYNLTKNFFIYSKIKDEDLISLYNKSKIGIFPSYAKEGVLLTMLEAASCGLPILTTNSCSMPEFIEDNKNGLLFNPHDSNDLAKKIVYILENKALQEELSKKAEENVKSKWDNKIRVEELYNVYKNIVGQYGRN